MIEIPKDKRSCDLIVVWDLLHTTYHFSDKAEDAKTVDSIQGACVDLTLAVLWKLFAPH